MLELLLKEEPEEEPDTVATATATMSTPAPGADRCVDTMDIPCTTGTPTDATAATTRNGPHKMA